MYIFKKYRRFVLVPLLFLLIGCGVLTVSGVSREYKYIAILSEFENSKGDRVFEQGKYMVTGSDIKIGKVYAFLESRGANLDKTVTITIYGYTHDDKAHKLYSKSMILEDEDMTIKVRNPQKNLMDIGPHGYHEYPQNMLYFFVLRNQL